MENEIHTIERVLVSLKTKATWIVSGGESTNKPIYWMRRGQRGRGHFQITFAIAKENESNIVNLLCD